MREFKLYEYPWPKLLGARRERWERVAALVDQAALNQHKHECPGTMADGHTRVMPDRFAGDHAEGHRQRIRFALVALLDAGIPRWLTEEESS